ncbi:MAG: leucine--tRNA ligase [Halobacteriales archaeon]|nr:leucine--tRNA ligase [Halobacteriales archaeon]
MDYEPRELEEKWRSRWRDTGRYEAAPDAGDGEDATFVTVPYPYPSGGMHIGHARTYTVPDTWARYRRLQGDNVLFPLAWHVTGTPIVGAVERLKDGEEEQLSVLRDTYNVPEETLQDLETPMGFAHYFIENHYKKNMKALGLSIDWRREFTTNDDRYSKFITWQYNTLDERGLLEKGYQPVRYCTNEEQPVTDHDLLEGEGADFQEYTLIKFEYDGTIAPMATLRPETVHGVTNAYVDPGAEYVFADVDDEEWLISAAAVEKFDLQRREIEVTERLSGRELVGEFVTNPVTGDEVPILPATFVDPDNATGVVMSVPAHSPDDWVALEEIKADAEAVAEEYPLDPGTIRSIEPVAILDIEGYGEYPAEDAVAERGIDSQDDPALEEATQELYNREFHDGVLRDMYGEFAGQTVEDARDPFRERYQGAGAFDAMYEFSEEVVCRCGADVEVSEQETWFLRYNDEDWRTKAKTAVENLDTIPENTRDEYYDTIDWLNEWPCIRNYGLGTRLPWDDDFVIEPLSDSTIYMAYYTIAPRLQEIPVEELDDAFFDALFYGPDAVEDPDERALELREEWQYWYPVDYRCSGRDLIRNHLTFYLYHHAELFEEANWPQGITTMGMGLLEGEAMSSSKGHVVLPSNAIDRYGADTVRFFLLNSSEPWQDYDWRAEEVESTRDQLERFWNRAQEIIDADTPAEQPDLRRIDRWLLSRLHRLIGDVTEAMDRFETRTASQAAFYEFAEDLRWYRRRTDTDRPGARWTLQTVLRTRLRLLAPFVPFMTNELHDQLVGEPVEDAAWPTVDHDAISDRIEIEERLIEELAADVREVIDVTDTDPTTIRLYTAADWKYTVFEDVVEQGPDVGAVMGTVMQRDALRSKGDQVNEVVTELVDDVRERPDEEVKQLADVDERAVYEAAEGFLEREFDAAVELEAEDEDPYDPADRAGNAVPFRPAIYLE